MIKLRKILIVVSILIIVVTVVTDLFLPNYISYTIYHYLQDDIHAQNIQGEVQTHPPFMIGTGRIDHFYYKMDSAVIDKTEVQNLLVTGDNLHINMADLLQKRFTVDSADDIALTCNIDERSLEKLLAKKMNMLRGTIVNITPQVITLKSNVLVLNNTISTTLDGSLYIADGNIYFKILDFDVENELLGKISLNVKRDILLLDKNKLPFNAKVDSITQEDEQISVKASAHKE